MTIYTFLGPEGTFTEAALLQVDGAAEAVRIPSPNVAIALEKVRTGEADAAMVPIENSVEGGVSATLDAIATGEPLGIIGEKLVPIRFVL
ncbi:prephenate dehydratase, partial [Arthrobacter deserti]|nr:prephenate dehydratase [Arthrobacter deserti]